MRRVLLLLLLTILILFIGNVNAESDHSGYIGEYKNGTQCKPCHAKQYNEMNSAYHATQGNGPNDGGEGMFVSVCIPSRNYLYPNVGGDTHAVCGRCHVGGGAQEPKAPIDCAVCHQASGYNYTARSLSIGYDKINKTWDYSVSMKGVKPVFTKNMTFNTCGLAPCHKVADEWKRSTNWSDPKFDVHVTKLSNCTSCHVPMSTNKHNFAKGNAIDVKIGDQLDNVEMKNCDSCHNISALHKAEPVLNKHLNYFTCTACHSLKLASGPGLGLKVRNWTLIEDASLVGWSNPYGEFRSASENIAQLKWWNGERVKADTVSPFKVLTIPTGSKGDGKLAPFNEVLTTYYAQGPKGTPDWIKPVPRKDLDEAAKNATTVTIAGKVYRYLSPEYMRSYANGKYPNATIRTENLYYTVSHGIEKKPVECIECHSDKPIVDFKALGLNPTAQQLATPTPTKPAPGFEGALLIIAILVGLQYTRRLH